MKYLKLFLLSMLIVLIVLNAFSCKKEIISKIPITTNSEKALEYYAKEDYMRAEGLFDQLKPILKGTKQADTVYYYAAYCSFNEKSYLLASHYFNEFKRTFGNSKRS